MENKTLENLCNKVKDFARSRNQKRVIYILLPEKRGGLIGEEKNALHKKTFYVSWSVFKWYSDDRHDFLGKKYFFNPKSMKDCSRYHFHYFLVSSDKYVNDYFWTLYKFINWNVLCNFNSDKMLLWMSLFTQPRQVCFTRSVFGDFYVCSDYSSFHSVLL